MINHDKHNISTTSIKHADVTCNGQDWAGSKVTQSTKFWNLAKYLGNQQWLIAITDKNKQAYIVPGWERRSLPIFLSFHPAPKMAQQKPTKHSYTNQNRDMSHASLGWSWLVLSPQEVVVVFTVNHRRPMRSNICGDPWWLPNAKLMAEIANGWLNHGR